MTKPYKILVSQPRPTNEHNPYAALTDEFGVEIDFHQFIRVEGLEAREFRKQRINPLNYTAVLFNSRMAADQFFRMCGELRVQVPDTMHYYCISESVANYLQKYIQFRKRKIFFAEHNKFEELLPTMSRRPQEKYLLVTSDTHSDDLINMFASHKIQLTPAVMYRTVAALWDETKPFDFQMVVLFTPTGATALHESFPQLKQGDVVLAAFGQNTINALQQYGLKPDITAPTEQFTSIPAAIRHYLDEHFS